MLWQELKNLPKGTFTKIADFPDGIQPVTSIYFSMTTPSGEPYRFNISDTGGISCYNYSSNQDVLNAASSFAFICK